MRARHVEQLIADYEAGDHGEALQEKIFKVVEWCRPDGDDDITELEDIGEAVSFLKRRIEHGRFKD